MWVHIDEWGVNKGTEWRKQIRWFQRTLCNEALKMPMFAANGSMYS
jgi:hypothetical protein